jgi:CRISPR/Cas system-associated protein endoribonuclease Cas2
VSTAITSANEPAFEFAVRVDTAGIRRLYPKVRKALLDAGYELTDTVDVMRVLERLIATSMERDAKRLHVCVQVLANGTHVKVIDRRRLDPRASLISDIVSRDIARSSGANLVHAGGGLAFWAMVDRHPGPSGGFAQSELGENGDSAR